MKKLQYKIKIHRPAYKVFNTMLGLESKETYRQWTSAFNATSTYEGNWEKGAKILFIGTSEEGKRGGMISEVAEIIPDRFVSIRHYGILDGDTEITHGPEVEKWAGGLENYWFDEENEITTLTVEVDTTEDFIEYFNAAWPKALKKLKEILENEG